ncbi:hypothetical protein PRIPAC_88545 [Pristionchus pacificus]|nr:hypothetical protein PRIPAC_88545 [Pristionchus pacificus]
MKKRLQRLPNKWNRCLYHVTLHAGISLTKVIASGWYSMNHVKNWTRELLSALLYLNSLEIICHDLRPDKICINDKTHQLTLLEFGKMPHQIHGPQPFIVLKGYEHYQAIEALVHWNGPLDKKVDIWSVSVILFELITGKTLFPKTVIFPVWTMIEYCGVDNYVLSKLRYDAEREELQEASKDVTRIDFIALLICSLEATKEEERVIQTSDIDNEMHLRDFIDSTLRLADYERMSADEAIVHPFLRTDPGSTTQISEDKEKTLRAWRHQLWSTLSSNDSNDDHDQNLGVRARSNI